MSEVRHLEQPLADRSAVLQGQDAYGTDLIGWRAALDHALGDPRCQFGKPLKSRMRTQTCSLAH